MAEILEPVSGYAKDARGREWTRYLDIAWGCHNVDDIYSVWSDLQDAVGPMVALDGPVGVESMGLQERLLKTAENTYDDMADLLTEAADTIGNLEGRVEERRLRG